MKTIMLSIIHRKENDSNVNLKDFSFREEHFGETIIEDCGICSYCITKTKTKKDMATLSEKIVGLLNIQDLNSRDIQKLTKFPKDDVIFALQDLLENNSVTLQPNNLYSLNNNK